MPESNPFRKPTGGGVPDRGDASAFLKRDYSEPVLPVFEPPPESTTTLLVPAFRRGRELKERKTPITYKHRERNFTLLKKLSQRLEISIGDLLDEALEAKIPEWKARAAQLPPDDFL